MPARSSRNPSAPPESFMALIGDLVHSRELEPAVRRRVQAALEAAFESVNREGESRRKGVASDLLLTLGDEFQGLFDSTPDGAERLLETLEAAQDAIAQAAPPSGAAPAPVRFGLGIGTLSTERKPRALGMDGPCLHRAREALEEARRTGAACRLLRDGAPHEAVWSLLATSWLETRAGWTVAQREAAALAGQGLSGKAVAERLGVTPGAVSQRLKSAHYAFVERARDALSRDLATLLKEEEAP